MKNILILSFLFFLPLNSALAQILDDSSRQIYSLRTVMMRQEYNMALNRGRLPVDTILEGFSEKLDFRDKDGKEFQNLGVFGSASRPILYELPVAIGQRNGMQAFDVLVPTKETVQYFNTLSPFSSIRYMQGARKRAMIQTTFSVNPMPRFNISAHYQRLTALRVVNVSSSDEREIDHHSLWLSSNYRSKNGAYRVWGHYRHLNHLQYETGAALPGGSGFTDSLFISPAILSARLSKDTRNRDLRNSWYFSQILKNGNTGLYLRSIHSKEKQVNRYGDSRPNPSYYGPSNFFYQADGPERGEPDSVFSQRVFNVWENTIAAGRQDSLSDFRVYLKRRDWTFENNYAPENKSGAEWIAGFAFDGIWKGFATVLKAEAKNKDEFDLNGSIVWKGWNLNGRILSFMPSMVQQEFRSQNLDYTRNFNSSRALRLRIEKEFRIKRIRIQPFFENIGISRGIAFDSTFTPFQSTGLTNITYGGLQFSASLAGRLHTSTRFTKTIQSGTRISGMPGMMLSSTNWFDLVKNSRAYAVQLGFQLDWRSDWQSEAYHSINAQWYLTKSGSIPDYVMMNAFAHVRIDRVRVFLRVHNVLQGLGSMGYFAAPGYAGQPRLFEIGLDWTFFD